jgi:biotin carboxylase
VTMRSGELKHIVFVTWKTGNAPAFAAAKRLGHRVTLVRSLRMERLQHVDFDATPYGEHVDEVIVLRDATEHEELRRCLTAVHRSRPIDGFLATVDALVVPVARIAEELGIPFTASRGAEDAKQKDRCRGVLAAAGIDDTSYAVVTDLAQAADFAGRAGYPIVVKPACASASEGAYVVATRAELDEAFAGAVGHAARYGAEVLAEQYLRGRFLSAEIGLAGDRVLRLAVSERKTWSRHEPLELGTTIPAVLDAEGYEAVMSFAEKSIRAMDLRLGIFHVEIMLGEDGSPRLIELNPRVMGSCLPNLFCLATGLDFFELLVRVYLNEPVEVGEVPFTGYSTVRWFGAAQAQPTPTARPDLAWADSYRPALHSLAVTLPDTEFLEPCRGNLGNFGEVQVVHSDHATSIRIAEEIVERVAAQLELEVTR